MSRPNYRAFVCARGRARASLRKGKLRIKERPARVAIRKKEETDEGFFFKSHSGIGGSSGKTADPT